MCKFDAIVALPDGKQPANKQSFLRAQLCEVNGYLCVEEFGASLSIRVIFLRVVIFSKIYSVLQFSAGARREQNVFSRDLESI